MADTKVILDAYYAKQDLRVLEQQLEEFKDNLRNTSNPRRREWLKIQIESLATVLHERTSMWY